MVDKPGGGEGEGSPREEKSWFVYCLMLPIYVLCCPCFTHAYVQEGYTGRWGVRMFYGHVSPNEFD